MRTTGARCYELSKVRSNTDGGPHETTGGNNSDEGRVAPNSASIGIQSDNAHFGKTNPNLRAGIEFIDENGGGAGVCLRRRRRAKK